MTYRPFRALQLAALFLSLVLPAAALYAQDSSAMTGIATDVSGAILPGTTVTLVGTEQGQVFTQTTDSKGSYRFANVPPHAGYKATFAHAGFADVIVDNITLSVGITRTQDAHLQAGSTQAVEVSASNAEVTLNTTDASIGNNFDVKLLQELPIQNRDSPTALFTLQAGYANGSFAGARTDQNSVTVDGIDVNDLAAGGFGVIADAPVDSVQEFRGTVTGLVPTVGTGSGAQFQLVTKSGTNSFHGDLNEYHRDTATAANDWFNNNVRLPRTPLIRNQFGGNIGGPILRDKLFFFFDFNNSRIIQSGSAERVVPLDSFRNGNINYILAKDAAGNPCSFTSRILTTPQCIGTLNSSQVSSLDPKGIGFDPALLTFINAHYPHANDLSYAGADGINTGGYRFTQPTPDTLYNYVGRVDYTLTPKQQIFARLTIDREDRVYALNNFPTDPLTNPFQNRSYGYVVSHIWQLGATKVNQFYYGDNISKFNFANLYNPQGAIQLNFGLIGNPYTGGSSQKRRVPVPEFRDDFNWTLGAHNLGFGGTFKFVKTTSNLVNDFSGVSIGLGGQTPGLVSSLRPGAPNNSYAAIRGGSTAPSLYDSAFAFALGRVAAIGSNYNYNAQGQVIPEGSGETRHYRFYQTEAYLGDTWKVSKQLTVTYGVRYQFYTVPYEVNGAESIQNQTFDQFFADRVAAAAAGKSGDTVIPFVTYKLGGKANNAAPLYNPSYKDFAPRLAFAFNPSYLPKTVFNASAALVYDRSVINAVNFIQDQSSFLFQNSATRLYGQSNAVAALSADPRLGANLAVPAPPTAPAIAKPFTPYVDGTTPFGGTSGGGYATIIDPTLKDPYSISMNAGVQQEFPGHFILKINYAGRLGRRLLAQADASQVVDFVDPASHQKLSAAFAAVTQQLRNGVATTSVTAQPWFENVVPAGTGVANGYANNTQFVVDNDASQVQNGDIADFNNFLLENGLIANNVGVGAQFALNPWITNKGFSSYNGLLVTLSKNLSQGVQFDVNYTWSHSIDNVSAPANYIAANTLVNFVCDVTQPRECRGNSDFDVQNVINSDFIAELPVGKGKAFLGRSNRLVNEVIGGWSVSGTPQWRSGLALGTVSNAFVASFNENAPALFNGNRAAVQAHAHKVGSSVQLFSNQTSAAAAFTGPIGLTIGSRNNLRGPSAFNMDAGLAKVFPIIGDRLNLKFRADFFNVLNHPTFGLPVNDITSNSFGLISSTSNSARVGQFSLRLEF